MKEGDFVRTTKEFYDVCFDMEDDKEIHKKYEGIIIYMPTNPLIEPCQIETIEGEKIMLHPSWLKNNKSDIKPFFEKWAEENGYAKRTESMHSWWKVFI